MAQVTPPTPVFAPEYICPFCQSVWEFIFRESYEQSELIFICQNCNKRFTISKYKK